MMTKSKVAVYLTSQINRSRKTQKQIAREAGFPAPNILSMVKSGDTKLPIARVPALAQSLEIEAPKLLRLCLEEYEPELLSVIDSVLPGGLLSEEEEFLILIVRSLYPAKAKTSATV